eukprot:TRINITY_DN68056_c2_g1_i2.p1 TRINITY_DN68056_c2_g1~~TRINITY_DN68056_c2_g1_i2.p1  ORF type:complete len:170 (-),score=3.98 TRINITY_DN68056_c2_g1_i2:52-561(-)
MLKGTSSIQIRSKPILRGKKSTRFNFKIVNTATKSQQPIKQKQSNNNKTIYCNSECIKEITNIYFFKTQDVSSLIANNDVRVLGVHSLTLLSSIKVLFEQSNIINASMRDISKRRAQLLKAVILSARACEFGLFECTKQRFLSMGFEDRNIRQALVDSYRTLIGSCISD